MGTSRSGHHGNLSYVFEDAGYNTSPNDTTFKNFGGSARLTTFDASDQASRIMNAGRDTYEFVAQNFEGGFEVTTTGFTQPPWWLAGVFGQPTSTNVSGSLYDYTYALGNGNDPVPLRIYLPTDGFDNYEYLPGCVIVDMSVSQSDDASPEITLSGFYADEPQRNNALSPSPPSFQESSMSNRDAELVVDSDTVGAVQDSTLDIGTGARGIRGFGTGTVSYPDEWSESGRNNPEENLLEQVNELGKDVTVLLSTDVGGGNPPGV